MPLCHGLDVLVDFADDFFYLTSTMDFGTVGKMFKIPDEILY